MHKAPIHVDRGFVSSRDACRETQLHLPGAFTGRDSRPRRFEPGGGVVRHAEEVGRLMVESQGLQGGGKRTRFAVQDTLGLLPHRLRQGRRQRMVKQLAHNDVVALQQGCTESVEKGEHVKPPICCN